MLFFLHISKKSSTFLFRFAQTIIAKQSSTYSPLFSLGAPSKIQPRPTVFQGHRPRCARPPGKKKGCWLNNHDYFFRACAFIIRQNNPIHASIMVLFRLDNKKECSFFEEIVVIICVCAIFIVSLQRI